MKTEIAITKQHYSDGSKICFLHIGANNSIKISFLEADKIIKSTGLSLQRQVAENSPKQYQFFK